MWLYLITVLQWFDNRDIEWRLVKESQKATGFQLINRKRWNESKKKREYLNDIGLADGTLVISDCSGLITRKANWSECENSKGRFKYAQK